MGYCVGYDGKWDRDIGYGVPGICDYPGCGKKIHRGLCYVCGQDPYGGDHGCGLFFCDDHLGYPDDDDYDGPLICERCQQKLAPFEPTPDLEEWILWKLTEPGWSEWRQENLWYRRRLARWVRKNCSRKNRRIVGRVLRREKRSKFCRLRINGTPEPKRREKSNADN